MCKLENKFDIVHLICFPFFLDSEEKEGIEYGFVFNSNHIKIVKISLFVSNID